MSPVQILLLEDNIKDGELLQATLEGAGLQCRIARVDTEASFAEALAQDFDLIISDYTLPSFDGRRALALAKKRRPEVPFIFVSGTIGEEVAIDSLLGGATDYVLKHKFGRLIPAVRRALHEAEERKARRRVEQQLEVTRQQLQNLFDNLDEVFFSLDSQSGRILQISPACDRVYGLPKEAFFANSEVWKACIHRDDRRAFDASLSGLRMGVSVSCEYRIQRQDGAVRWLHTKMKPILDPQGGLIRVDGITSDITERKELEAQSLRAQRMENLGRLAGGIAHDLNNLLSPIAMGVELFREKYKDPQTLQTVNAMEFCVTRGTNLVKQILMFARGADGVRTALNPSQLITQFREILLETFPRSIRIVTDIEPGLWSIFADQTQFEQVVMNLCMNARDAMPDGGTLAIRVRNETRYVKDPLSGKAKSNPYVVVQVADTGHGIAGENLDQIFEPFFTTKESGAGTGLGLSTVNSIVKSHGGFVRVESAVSKGTTFKVYLPAIGPEPQTNSLIPGAEDLPPGNGEQILIVDDEAAMRDLCRTFIENYGYRVLVAGDGAEALALYAEHPDIRLVITDLDMPTMNGASLIRALEEINPAVRIVTATGSVEEGAFGHTVAGPVRAVLQKPFSPSQLSRLLRETLRSG